MCGRYSIFFTNKQLKNFFGVNSSEFNFNFNASPSQALPLITNDFNQVQFLNWGLIPYWAKDRSISSKLINARSETLLDKPSFKKAALKRHCLVPASGYFEWKVINGKKQPFYISFKYSSIMAFAGLWEVWHDPINKEVIKSFTIITKEAEGDISSLHHRMPIIVSYDFFDQWLNSEFINVDSIKKVESSSLQYYPVSTDINLPVNNYPELLNEVPLN